MPYGHFYSEAVDAGMLHSWSSKYQTEIIHVWDPISSQIGNSGSI